MTDENPFAEYANSGGGKPSASDNPFEEFANKPAGEPEAKSEKNPTYEAEAKVLPGYYERENGLEKTLNDIGVGKYFPTFRNGKLSVGLPPNEELAKQEQVLEDANRGIKGTLKEMATDPLTYLPFKGGLVAGGAKQGALSSALAPTTNPDKTLTDRAIGTAEGGILGAMTGGAFHGVGAALPKSLRAAGKETIPAASKIYEQAKAMGLSFTGKETPEQVWGKIQEAVKGNTAKIADTIAKEASNKESIWPVGVNLATSQMYDATKQAGSVLYDQARKIGVKEELPAEDVIKDLDGFIAGMEKDAPLHAGIDPNFNSKLTKIRTLRDTIAGDGEAKELSPWEQIQAAFNHAETNAPKTLNGSQLIELDQAVNSFYGAKGTGDKANIPVNKIKATFDKAVGNLSPEFQGAYSKAKNYWRQNVIQNFEDNKVLGKYWKPEDYEAFKAITKGIELSPNLKARAEDMLDNIKTPLQLEELKKALPPQMYDRLRAAKFVTMMDEAGINSKIIADDKNYKMLVKTLANDPAAIAALDSVKTFTEEMNRRGINRELTAAELQASDGRMDRIMRTAFSFATGHKLYALRHAMESITGDSPNAAQGRLQGFAKEIAKSEPGTAYTPGALPKAALKPIATEEGKATQ